MPAFHAKRLLPYTPEQLYQLITHVEAYPDFVPGCRGAVVHEKTAEKIHADLEVNWGPWQGTFTSWVSLSPPHTVHVKYTEGPFQNLESRWQLIRCPAADTGAMRTKLNFFIEVAFDAWWKNALAGSFFPKLSDELVQAFEARASKLYGSGDRQKTL